MSKKKYPPEEGWLHLDLTMKDKTPRAATEIKSFAAWMNGGKEAKVEDYEYAVVEQYGAKVKIVFRGRKVTPTERAAADGSGFREVS